MRALAFLGVAVLAVTATGCGGARSVSDKGAACWQVASTMTPGDAGNSLSDVEALSPTDAWAVGSARVIPRRFLRVLTSPRLGGLVPPQRIEPLIEHWDGKTWTRVPAPAPVSPRGDSWGGFTAVAPISRSDVWAVGSDNSPATTEHWEGRAWNVVPNPAFSDVDASLYDVAGTGPDDVWAVGEHGYGDFPLHALIEHWNGHAWSIVPTPNVDPHPRPTIASQLNSVAAISPTDAWAVGQNWAKSLVEHWDGRSWKAVDVPSDGRSDSLTEVEASGPNDVWAAGTSYRDVDGHGPTYGVVLHFDGSKWTITRILGFDGRTVSGLAVQSAGRVWVTGYWETSQGEASSVAVLTKGRWHEEQVPGPKGMGISSIDALPGGRIWLAGSAPAESYQEAAVIQTRCP